MHTRSAATVVIISILVILVVPNVLGSPTPVLLGPAGTIAPASAATPTTNPRYLPLVRNGPTLTPSLTPINTLTPSTTPTDTSTPTVTRTPTDTPTASPSPSPSATGTPVLPPSSFVDCGTPPSTTNTVNWPIQIVGIDKVQEQVTLFNRSPNPVDLTSWHMCSISGGQSHPISGILGAFTVQTYTNTGGPIWNNSTPDPGALYNPAGQLVAYFDS